MKFLYALLARLFPHHAAAAADPRRIVLILPCCIGDVVLGTAALAALRRAYPDAQITWAVGSWSRRVLEGHPLLNDLLDTGPAALPVKSPRGLLRFVRLLRKGRYDLAVSLVRSPLMSLAVWLAGIPQRAGLDSVGRGFGYNIRARIDPDQPRHEADIYLEVLRALGLPVEGVFATIPLHDADRDAVRAQLAGRGCGERYLVVNPAGGQNPGMTLDAKRWPPQHFAALINRLTLCLNADAVLVAGPDDAAIIAAVQGLLEKPAISFVGELTFGQIGALAVEALLYIGNDTGLTHYAAAVGAKTVMILGPSDPVRYAPFAPDALAVWKPSRVVEGGVAGGAPKDWDWLRDGITVEEAERQIVEWMG